MMNTKKQSMTLIVFLVLSLLSSLSVSAQKLTVESMEQVPDATASMFEYQLEDNNGDLAGIVKVLIAVDGVKFDGGGVLKQQKMDMGEYWVWMAKDSSRLTVRAPGFLPLEVNFRNYEGVNIVHSKTTYKLVVTVPNAAVQPESDNKGFLIFVIEPKNANLSIDGKLQPLQDGQYSNLVVRGTYNYEVAATGYTTQRGTVRVDGNNDKPMKIHLESTMSTLVVNCATAGVQIYLDGQLKGPSPQTFTLSGSHRIEARLDGYRSYREDITLGEKENRRLDIPALVRLTGSLRVNYIPIGSEVYVDGVKLGANPGTFRDVSVGSHTVEIRKDGYVSERKSVTLRENAITDLSGSLTASATPVQNNTTNQNGNAVSQVVSTSGNIQPFVANGVSFNMVRVEGGTYTDGSGDKKTVGTFMIGETEVTQELWEAVMGKNPSRFKGAKNPVENVSWEDCQEFIEKLNRATGQRFRLPTEWEWEFAACGGTKSRGYEYSGSNDIDEVAWYEENAYKKGSSSPDYGTHPVGKKRANELGIYDMSGNVREWCEDLYSSSSSDRVTRGGGWISNAGRCRVSVRSSSAPGNRSNYLGFRLAH